VYIRAGLDHEETDWYPVTLSGDGSNISWTIPLYENNFPSGSGAVTGQQEVPFRLTVVLADGSDYRVELGTKTLDLTSKENIAAENIGTKSLNAVTLSGTITVTINGQPVPRVEIRAQSANGNSLGSTPLYSPGAGTAWSLTIAAFDPPADVRISVYGSGSNGKTVFYREPFTTLTGVSNTNRSDININLGNIRTVTLSGTATVTYNGQPVPYVEIRALSANGNQQQLGSTQLDSPGANAPWSITISPLDSPADVTFAVSGYNSNWEPIFNQLNVQTVQNVSDTDKPDISISYSGGNGVPAPTGLNASASGNTITLTWNSVSGASSYKVYRSGSSSGSYTSLNTASSASYTDSGLAAGTYYYKVSAVSSAGEGPQSSSASVTVSGGGDNPALTIDNVAGNTTVKITKTTISADTVFDSLTGVVATGQGTHPLLGWTTGEEITGVYNVMLRLVGSPNTVKYQNGVSFTNGSATVNWNTMLSGSSGGGLSAPTGLSAAASGTSITLSWTSVSGAGSYRIYRSISSDGGYSLVNGSVVGTSYTDSGLAAGTYYYKVSAYGSGQESEQSSYASATVSSGGLSAPTGLNATDSETSITLSWTSVSGASSYKVYRSGSSSGSYTSLNTASNTSYTDSGLSVATYYYKVSTVSSAGTESPQSSAVSATVSLSGPSGIGITVSGNNISLSWYAVSGASYYKIYRDTSQNGTYPQIDTSSIPVYTDSDLPAGRYYYKISAVSSDEIEGKQSGTGVVIILSAPTGLNATVSGSSVSLSWTAVDGAARYHVYRSTTDEEYSYMFLESVYSPSYTDDSGLAAGTYYYKVAAETSGWTTGPQSSAVSATVSGGSGGGGDTLAGAKGKLTLTGFSGFDGKYVYSALVTSSGNYLIGTNGIDYNAGDPIISMVPISGGTVEVPLYTATTGTSVADIYVPYEGSETIQTVSIIIVNDADGKFTASDAASFATNYAAIIGSNALNTSFTASTTNGSITISRSDVITADEMTMDNMYTAKYMLILAQ
jgi:fibronectin type 3 domain-containing protein